METVVDPGEDRKNFFLSSVSTTEDISLNRQHLRAVFVFVVCPVCVCECVSVTEMVAGIHPELCK